MISEELHQIKENETFSATRSEGEGKNIAFANKYFYIRSKLGESIAYCTMKDNVIDMFNPETRQHFPSFRGILLQKEKRNVSITLSQISMDIIKACLGLTSRKSQILLSSSLLVICC
mgnify:CR=1 FL=1